MDRRGGKGLLQKIPLSVIRRCTQGIFLLVFLFLFLQTQSQGGDRLGYPVRIFLDFDPLIFISVLLSSHAIVTGLLLSLILIALTALLGRVFCGWICPFGTLHDMAGAFNARRGRPVKERRLRLKYYILIVLLGSSLMGGQLTGIVDPISLLIRSLALGIYPLFNYVINAVAHAFYQTDVGLFMGVSDFVHERLKGGVMAFEQPLFRQGLLMSIILGVLLALNLVERRFWCRYLCPLGALLAILSRYALLKRSISEGCTSCGACDEICAAGKDWRKEECVACLLCRDICPEGAISFGFKGSGSGTVNLRRRSILASIAAGVASVPLFRIAPGSASGTFHPALIRPPGSLPEEEFLTRCIRCGECMKVCLTNGLQPTLLEAGLEGMWTPLLVPRVGFCEYRCTLCGQVCPTGAIRRLSVEENTETKIGMAVIDPGRCLPYASATPCIVCEEVCPTAPKAIWTETVSVRDRSGDEVILKQPHIDPAACVGCGICETMCPVAGKPAIYVISTGETRSPENRLLL